ncbi:MAG TPA: DoxX family protein [Acidimicrobiia bacterium]|jgi:hypothetical protein|nr:DoxX family protein [Acidimicrobiia bacterium]
MSTVSFVVHVLLAGALAGSATAALTRYEPVLVGMARAGVPESVLPLLGTLKAAAALGLLVGLAVPWIGTAAAAGTVVYFAGAIVTHLRARDYALAPASSFAVLAVAALALGVAA